MATATAQAQSAPIRWTDNVQPATPAVEQAILDALTTDIVSGEFDADYERYVLVEGGAE